jgi:hypothetical protein
MPPAIILQDPIKKRHWSDATFQWVSGANIPYRVSIARLPVLAICKSDISKMDHWYMPLPRRRSKRMRTKMMKRL